MRSAPKTWKNWGRNQSVKPARYTTPATISELQSEVKKARAEGLKVKPIGSGHSFTGAAVAPGLLIDLTKLSGVINVDRETKRVTLFAGTKLHQIPALLAPFGLAMLNLGDIDRQSVAGVTATGSHGTGAKFKVIATAIVGAKLVNAAGELVTISETENAELLPAAAIGLGALGIIVEVTIQCVDRFLMSAVEHPEPVGQVLETLDERVQGADHFEFFWFPDTETAVTKTNTRLPGDGELHPLGPAARWLDETLLANGVYRAVCAAATVAPRIQPTFAQIAAKRMGDREYTDISTNVLTQRRNVRFLEMEYAIPIAEVRDTFTEVKDLIARSGWRITFPIEVRFGAADDLWLSPAYGRDTGYIAVHRYFREDPTEYFAAVEEIMLAHGGRPHLGKLHTLGAAQLRERLPRFDDFLAVRNQLDPDRIFANPYLTRVLGD